MKIVLKIILCLFIGVTFLSCGISKSLQDKPQITSINFEKPFIEKRNDSLFVSGENFIIKNKQQLWELHVSGNEWQRGLLIGGLSEDLFLKQERIFFSKIQEMVPSKFKQKVLPGDTLIFKCDLITPIRRGICHMQAYAYANGKLVAEAELMAQISKIK